MWGCMDISGGNAPNLHANLLRGQMAESMEMGDCSSGDSMQ